MRKKKTKISKKKAGKPKETVKEGKKPVTSNNDFGGLPDIDPKRFLGCG